MDNDKYIGQMLDGRYEILERIGSGGMAVVYKARCHRLNRFVAVKILKDDLANDPEFRRRFRTESQAVAMLSHPNIVSVYDVSKTGNTEYIVMELIEGITLKQYINRKGVLNWKETLHFTTQIVKALSHAHSRGIIHRDIKPHNIMILKDGSVKVADFGIAQLLSTQNTLTQDALGSVHYISPEQAKGAHVDARTDLYSVGVVMYEMLTSRLPFVGDSAVSVAIQHISAIPLMPREINPDIPVGLESIAMHAMEPDLSRRYLTADEMLVDLEEFRKNPSVVFPYELRGGSAVVEPVEQETSVIPSDEVSKVLPVIKPLPKAPVKRTPVKQAKPEPTKDEYRKNRQKSSRTSLMIGIVCIIVFLIVLFIFMFKYILKDMLDPSEEMVTIPSFLTQNYYDFYDDPEYTKYFNFSISEERYSDEAEGYVISQTPQADRQQVMSTAGIDISFVISAGPEPDEAVTIKNLVGSDYREATIYLESLNLNLKVDVTYEPSDTVTENYVITQYPDAGTALVEGGTVYLTYSTGPEVKTTTVPNVLGLTLNEAILRLESYNLTYEYSTETNDKPANEVIFQSLENGETVEVHTKVTLIVSSGPQIPSDTPDVPQDDPGSIGSPTEPTSFIDRIGAIFR